LTDNDNLRRTADAAIVIFGAAIRPDGQPSPILRLRVEAAALRGTQFSAPIFVPTGGVGRHGPSEASVMARLLGTLGVPTERIILEESATDTLSSVRAVRRLLRAHAITAPLWAASSPYHLPRCLLLLRVAGLPAYACPPPAASTGEGWRRWYWRLRELAALPYDAVLIVALRLSRRL
jgi:uncharacterized SAM-binding protein YcdF (DUF218 family)